MKTVFVSHASGDRVLALKVKELLTLALGGTRSRPTIFCSSDVGDIEGGKEWLEEIMHHLNRASACVTLVTPQSTFGSPWVAYESGGAYLRFKANRKKSRLFPACAKGIPKNSLPSIFKHLQARDLCSREDVVALVKEVASCISATAAVPRRAVGRVVNEASQGPRHWEFVDNALVGQRQGSSPFSFDSLIPEAKTEIACAGFSLHHIATSARCKAAVFEFIRSSPKRNVRLLITDHSEPSRLALWEAVGKTYLTDLRKAVSAFSTWLRDAKREGLAERLQVAFTPFVGLTVVCVDPERSDAVLVLTPSIVGKPLSVERPHVVLTRSRQSAAFSYYWDAYQDLFKRARPMT